MNEQHAADPYIDLPRMSVDDFRNGGYLQEANRQFFHPLGLALSVDSRTGRIFVIDYRDDPEGVVYCRLPGDKVQANADAVAAEKDTRAAVRVDRFGWAVQPVDDLSSPCPDD